MELLPSAAGYIYFGFAFFFPALSVFANYKLWHQEYLILLKGCVFFGQWE